MNFVEPIRDRKKLARIKNLLRGQSRYRDLLLFVVGINTALRISDLLQLCVEHFLNDHRQIMKRFWIKEQKRGKRHKAEERHLLQSGGGVSIMTDAYGRVINRVDVFEEENAGTWSGEQMVTTPVGSIETLYPIIGDSFGMSMLVVMLVLLVCAWVRRKKV